MNINKGDIVQITDENHHWFPALIVVSEVKGFGCQGYAMVPDESAEQGNNLGGRAYIRLNENTYEKVGHAVLVSA